MVHHITALNTVIRVYLVFLVQIVLVLKLRQLCEIYPIYQTPTLSFNTQEIVLTTWGYIGPHGMQDLGLILTILIILLAILQDYCFLHYQMCDWASDYIVLYVTNDCNSITLHVGRYNKRVFFFLNHNRLVRQVVWRPLTIVK